MKKLVNAFYVLFTAVHTVTRTVVRPRRAAVVVLVGAVQDTL